MKTIAKIAMVASALLLPTAANAALADGTYRGAVRVLDTLVLSCTLTAVVSGGGTAVSFSLSGGMCGASIFHNQPYAMASAGTTSGTYTFHSIDATLWGSDGCRGDMTGTWNGDVIRIDAFLPPKVNGQGCRIAGLLTKIN